VPSVLGDSTALIYDAPATGWPKKRTWNHKEEETLPV